MINKSDNQKLEQEAFDFYRSGVDQIYPISATHNRGIKTLFKAISKEIPLDPIIEQEDDFNRLRIAIVGKPNVGKSSLVNALLGEKRMIVTSQAGTTRDSIDSILEHQGKEYLLIDTAGVRKKSKVKEKLEIFSVVSALRSIQRADVTILVFDATEGITDQVKKLANYAAERKKAIILVGNKWDLIKKNKGTLQTEIEEVYYHLPFLEYAPLLFTSTITQEKIFEILKTATKIYQKYQKRVQTADFNRILQLIVNRHQPPAKNHRPTKIQYGSQIKSTPPTFVVMTNHPDSIPESYERCMIHQIRYHFDFEGVPIQIFWRKKSGKKN